MKVKLTDIKNKLDDFFEIKKLALDPSMSKYIPMVYDPIGFDWKNEFEKDFTERLNGLMVRGLEQVENIWCIVFPSDVILADILAKAKQGDLIFSHHPINMECGDPQDRLNSNKGRGFLPISPELIKSIKERKLSFYACHAPLDTNRIISTNNALANLIDGKIEKEFYPYGIGFAGLVCVIDEIQAQELAEKLRVKMGMPYLELSGNMDKLVKRVAIIAGGAGSVNDMQEAEKMNVDCLITGEVSAKIQNERGRSEQTKIELFLPQTDLALIGLSHAGSEFVVIRDQIVPWLREEFELPTTAVGERNWWR